MNKVVVAAMLVLVGLAGCTEGGSEPDPVVDDFRDGYDEQDAPVDSNEEQPEEPGQAEDREVVVLHPTLVAGEAVVNAGAEVTFTVDATASDANGDPRTPVNGTWAIFSEDESLGHEASGEGFPGTATFTLETVGEITFIAGVSADDAEEAFANITIQVIAANEEAAPEPETWWLYMESSCSEDGKLKRAEGGPDGGCIGTDSAVSPVLGEGNDFWRHFFYSEGTSAGALLGAPFSGSASFTALPGLSPMAVLEIDLLANGNSVYSEVKDGIGPAAGPVVVVTWEGTLEAAIPAGANLELRLRMVDFTTTGYAFPEDAGGSDSDWITIG